MLPTKIPRLLVRIAAAFSLASASADDFGESDFSLRFPATLTRFSVYADAAAKGGASAAGKFGSSINQHRMPGSFPSTSMSA